MKKCLSLAAMDALAAFAGLWTRSLIAWPDGRRDVTSNVAWLQGPTMFVDLRQPASLASGLSNAGCLADLTARDCLALSAQQGFAGTFLAHAETFEWNRRVDYQPPTGVRDIGRLFWQNGMLVEEGVETDYTEHWHRDTKTPPQPCACLALAAPGQGIAGFLVRAGDDFMYARDRQVPAVGASLAQAVGQAGSLAAAQALVDFEISYGRIGPDGWRIRRSSLPYRAGAILNPRFSGDGCFLLDDVNAAGRPFARVWDIAAAEGDISAVPATAQNFCDGQ